MLRYGIINAYIPVAYLTVPHRLCDQRPFVGGRTVPMWPIVSKGLFVAVRCTLGFWAKRSGEPEHFPLTRPIKRDGIGAGELATGQINGLRSIHDGCNDIGRKPRDPNQLSEIPSAVF